MRQRVCLVCGVMPPTVRLPDRAGVWIMACPTSRGLSNAKFLCRDAATLGESSTSADRASA